MRNWNIGTKVSATAFAIVGVMFFAFVTLASIWATRLAQSEAEREVSDKTRMLADTVELVDTDLRKQVATFGAVFKSEFAGEFRLDPGASVDVAGQQTPVLLNGKPLNLDFSVPDRFTQLTGVYATVFVRRGDDFIRISTSHKKENGARAIGTLLDHAHPGYRLVLDGQTYTGPANLFGGMYMTRYEPIKDAAGKVIGILYVGIGFDQSLKTLKDKIKALRIGDSGQFYALEARPGKDLGKLLIHRSAEGQNLLDAQDDDGHAYIRQILEQKQGNLRFRLQGQERIASFNDIQAWHMVVVGESLTSEITQAATQMRNRAAAIAVVMVLATAAMLYPLLRRLVTKPLAYAVRKARTVASGDLSVRIRARTQDETGQLLVAMQDMSTGLAHIVSQVRSGTGAIESASHQIAAGNRDLAQRTESQASSIEETAASMRQLTGAVQQNADSARQASALAESASAVAQRGGAVVAQVVSTMAAIQASAQQIADITGVIDGLAFQTNILALNAAVEAARAGEQGRGFAVVASEVRNLAQRSATAAKEIRVLIGTSVEQVQAGGKLVEDAGATMADIVTGVQQVTAIMSEILAASREQHEGIGQVNSAIASLDQAVQNNAALVEQVAAAAGALEQQAGELAQLVNVFKLDSTPALAGAPAAALRAP